MPRTVEMQPHSTIAGRRVQEWASPFRDNPLAIHQPPAAQRLRRL